ncbi:efflux RND transporter permease subunit, partial [bacterium]|nr:efflux RND transporter permease subunit [bacterium]
DRIGFPEGLEEAGVVMGLADTNEGEFFIKLVPKSKRKITTRDFIEEIRSSVKQIPGLKMNLRQSFEQLFNSDSAAIEIHVLGQHLPAIKEIMDLVKTKLGEVDGIRDIDSDLKGGKPELRLIIDRNQAIRAGLSVPQIGESVRTALQGRKITHYRSMGDELYIRLQGPRELENYPSLLLNLPLEISQPFGGNRLPHMIPVGQIATFSWTEGEEKLYRQRQMRMGTVFANYAIRSLGDIMSEVTRELDKIAPPEGNYIEVGGIYKDQLSAIKQLTNVFLLGMLLVYMIMASQFESFKDPFCIFFSVPLACIGLIFGLFVCGQTLNVSSALGMVVLLGIAVNNAIVLIDYIKQLRHHGLPLIDAVVEGTTARLRPIAMTSITTVLGLIPLSLGWGEGSEVQQPLAISVIGGLSFSTLLTLIVVPCIYFEIERRVKP